MGRIVGIGLLALAASGCAAGPPVADSTWPAQHVLYDNPTLLPITDHQYVWETVVDVVDDYFKIKEEKPVLLAGHTALAGGLDTFPTIGSTLFEPWRHDSVGPDQRLESTLQTIRRQARVRVIPAEGGYLVDVAVFKWLEDVAQPAHATAGAATFRHDSSLTRVVSPVGRDQITRGWISRGRDTALEQRIMEQLLARTGAGWGRWGPPRL